MSEVVEVMHIVNGTTVTETYTCEGASVTMAGAQSPHATVIRFTEGFDADRRPVTYLMLRNAEKVTRRPAFRQAHRETSQRFHDNAVRLIAQRDRAEGERDELRAEVERLNAEVERHKRRIEQALDTSLELRRDLKRTSQDRDIFASANSATAEMERLRAELAEAKDRAEAASNLHANAELMLASARDTAERFNDLTERLCALMPEEFDGDEAVEALILRWVQGIALKASTADHWSAEASRLSGVALTAFEKGSASTEQVIATLNAALTDRERKLAQSDADNRAMVARATELDARVIDLTVQLGRVCAAINIADDEDLTDWQRGYRACAERVWIALGHAPIDKSLINDPPNDCPACSGVIGGPHDTDCVTEKLRAEVDTDLAVSPGPDVQLAEINARGDAERDVIAAARTVDEAWRSTGTGARMAVPLANLSAAVDALVAAEASTGVGASGGTSNETGPSVEASEPERICSICDCPVTHAQAEYWNHVRGPCDHLAIPYALMPVTADGEVRRG